MEEKNQRAIEFLRKKSDLKKGEKGKETFFYKNTQDVKIRILCTGMDFYCESEKRKKSGWSDFVKQNDATPYKKKNEWLAVKDQTQSTGEQCDLLYTLFQKWEEFSSSSEITQLTDTKAKDKKKSFEYVYESAGSVGKFNGNADEFLKENILGKVNGEKKKIPYVASFADWSDDFKNNLNKIEGNTILLGLNISSSIEEPWENFHSKSNEDKRLKYACEGVFDRAYITDLIKCFPNGNSSETMNAFKNNETLRHASVEMFLREIAFLIHCGLIEKNKPLHTVLLGSTVQECMKCKIAQKKIKDIICDEINNLGCKKIIFGKAYHYSFRKCSMSEDQANKEYREQFKRLKEKMTHAGNGEVVENPHCFKKNKAAY